MKTVGMRMLDAGKRAEELVECIGSSQVVPPCLVDRFESDLKSEVKLAIFGASCDAFEAGIEHERKNSEAARLGWIAELKEQRVSATLEGR